MIRTESLSVRYGSVTAVHEASIEVKQGRIAAIVGPSGCGKSSFLSALNRLTDLVPSACTSGSVWIDGREIHAAGQSPTELRRSVGMIFQRPNPFPMSIRHNIHLALREHGLRRRAERDEIMETALRDVGLWDEVRDRLDAPARQLSGGQQQRLCIARALALQPNVLLLDEPCSALDPISSDHVERLIASLRGRLTIVIVTHNLAQARRLADDLIVFWFRDSAGVIIEQGPVEQIFTAPKEPTTAAYLSGARG